MSDGIAYDSKDLGFVSQFVRAIEMLQIAQGDLTRSGRVGDRRVSQGAAFPERQNSGRLCHFSHWHEDRIPGGRWETFGRTSQAKQL